MDKNLEPDIRKIHLIILIIDWHDFETGKMKINYKIKMKNMNISLLIKLNYIILSVIFKIIIIIHNI